MVIALFDEIFRKKYSKINNGGLKQKLEKALDKIIHFPEIGKPMRFIRKNTREVYVQPFRLSYIYLKEQDKIIFLDIYHKDEQ